jgi:3-hydroxy acid dehydrogenase/malonic semialdehyde reductase
MGGALSGKTVLVTGASAGIGRASAIALAEAGAKIIATGRRKGELDTLARECGGAVTEAIAGDLNDARFVADLAKRSRDVDILVNNAGILKYAPVMDMTDGDVEAMFRTNVLAAFRVTHAVAKSMMDRRRGHIIVMTSIAAREVYPLGVIYCATKHALSAITRGLRVELQSYGIKVTEIAPGMVDTAIRATSDHPRVQEALKVRKFEALTPGEVADAVVYAAESAPNCCPDFIELRPQGAA